MLRGGLVESGLKLFEFRPDRFCCVKRFVASFFVARSESMLLTIVFDALMLCRNRDVPVPFSVLGLWGLHGSSYCTSGSQASVVRRTEAVGTWCCIATATPTILSMHWICGNVKVFCVSESRAPALHHKRARPQPHP